MLLFCNAAQKQRELEQTKMGAMTSLPVVFIKREIYTDPYPSKTAFSVFFYDKANRGGEYQQDGCRAKRPGRVRFFHGLTSW